MGLYQAYSARAHCGCADIILLISVYIDPRKSYADKNSLVARLNWFDFALSRVGGVAFVLLLAYSCPACASSLPRAAALVLFDTVRLSTVASLFRLPCELDFSYGHDQVPLHRFALVNP